MKLGKKNTLTVSFMLFSLFFGAGNLIFPPFLGQNAANAAPGAFLGFLITAVILPVLGVVVVAKFGGLDALAGQVGNRFAFVFTILIYLSIGPGLGIPRAASVPFEMAVAPYLPENSPTDLYMLIYSLVFFLLACWLCLTPQKLVNRVGRILTPTLLCLITIFFISFLLKGQVVISEPQPAYSHLPFLQGFIDGYQTMDTIAALNFGLVISMTLMAFGMDQQKEVIHHTIKCGIFAGSILTLVYLMLAYIGMASSGVYTVSENGAVTLRQVVYQVFGAPGAVLLAAIFTLACLTTCVGLINSISTFFSRLYPKLRYKVLVVAICVFSFGICNQGLTAILNISIPVLNAIYPISIMLIVLGLTHRWHGDTFPELYLWTITGTGIVSVVYALDKLNIHLWNIPAIFAYLPFYEKGFGWVSVSLLCAVLCIIRCHFRKK